MTSGLLVGVFVGGRGSRMGGVAKGLLPAPGALPRTLLERLLGELQIALPGAPIVLVGEAGAYAAHGLQSVSDVPSGVGPIGGLGGLLREASERGFTHVLALACDLPKLQGALLSRLATEAPHAIALVTQQGGVRNPLIARYEVKSGLAAVNGVLSAGKSSLQAVLDALESGLTLLALSEAETATLADWDSPEDVGG